MNNIRNFALVAHIDHGKSTLADRLMEEAGLLPPSADPKSLRIDRMELEVERGVTIKLKAVRMAYHPQIRNPKSEIRNKSQILNPNVSNSLELRNSNFEFACSEYVLNMIDTPGHVDFSYEVSRSLAACEGILLLVDATQGPQAQTVHHLEKARGLGLSIIGVINKIDSPLARIEETEEEMRSLGIEGEILKLSALKREGMRGVMETVVSRIPAPRGELAKPFRALVFDSTYDDHLGVIAYIRVFDGALEAGNMKHEGRIKLLGTGAEAGIKEIGHFVPDRRAADSLSAGEVGYLATGLKDPHAVRVGDTVALVSRHPVRQAAPLPGYRAPQSFVFASFFPAAGDFVSLKRALDELRLEEPAVSSEEVASPAFGRGFKLGFLGTFHLEIVKERLQREFNLELIVTKPTAAFRGLEGGLPAERQEPWIKVTIITPPDYLSGVIKLVESSRGVIAETVDFGRRLKIMIELPLMEFIRDFYDQLKSLSSGYASLDWEFSGYRPADLVKLDIAVHDDVAEGLSEVVLKDRAQKIGREKVRKLKEVMPRMQFAYALQAKVGGKVVAREDVPAVGKDVLAKLSGGDVTRKRKLLKKQRKGKKRLALQSLGEGGVKIPPKAFLV
jgi:GTP-binding protein LepA